MTATENATNTEKSRVLIVDDNRDAAYTLAMMLKFKGFETMACYSALEGIEAAESFRPLAIILDIGMPDITGYEACRRIREQPWGADPVIIALTGYGSEEDRQKSKESGFDAHLLKPVDVAGLISLLNRR